MNEIFEFNASLWVDNTPKADLSSTVFVRIFDKPTNSMEGKYTLYNGRDRDLDSTIFIYQATTSEMRSTMKVRIAQQEEMRSYAMIKYRDNSELRSTIQAIAGNYIEGFLEVKPNNRMFGDYEMMEAPRITKPLTPVKDAFTRDSIEYQSLNWGSEKRMMTGRDLSNLPLIETFESFLEFDLTKGLGYNKLIEKATLRLYYANGSLDGVPLEFRVNNTYWSEMGITHINKPLPKEIITDKYTVNKTDRYIEIDLTDVVLRWYDGTLSNFGLSVHSNVDIPVTFYTKENGVKQPTLFVKYIDLSMSYTATRYELDAKMFIIGRGFADLNSKMTVHSTVGLEWKEATLFVHKFGVPVPNDKNVNMTISRPELHSTMFVYKKGTRQIDGSLVVIKSGVSERPFNIASTKPELHGQINLDPNAHLHATIQPKIFVDYDPNAHLESNMVVNKPIVRGFLEVKSHYDIQGTITIKPMAADERIGFIGVPIYVGDKSPVGRDDGDKAVVLWSSRPELDSTMFIFQVGEKSIDGFLKVYERTEVISEITGSRPELAAKLMGKVSQSIDATIYVRGSSFLDASLTVHHWNQIEGTLLVKAINQVDVEIAVSRPEIIGTIFRRYAADDDLRTIATIRQRDASDLHARFGARGSKGGAYYFIL